MVDMLSASADEKEHPVTQPSNESGDPTVASLLQLEKDARLAEQAAGLLCDRRENVFVSAYHDRVFTEPTLKALFAKLKANGMTIFAAPVLYVSAEGDIRIVH